MYAVSFGIIHQVLRSSRTKVGALNAISSAVGHNRTGGNSGSAIKVRYRHDHEGQVFGCETVENILKAIVIGEYYLHASCLGMKRVPAALCSR